jgi:hypothetical protein
MTHSSILFSGAIFTPNCFEIDTTWPVIHSGETAKPHFVLELPIPHPDVSAAGHIFRSRYSPREFSADAIPPELISAALQAARRSPSAGNLQAYSLILITNRSKLELLSVAAHQKKLASVNLTIARKGRICMQ